jgi:uncharacterized protein YabE (DUF348 family)
VTVFSPDDTQPTNPFRPQRRRKRIPRAWAALLAVAALVQVALILLLVLALANREPEPQPVSVTLNVGGEILTRTTLAKTVGDLLTEANIVINEGDVVSARLTNPISEGMTVEIKRARPVTVTVDGTPQVFNTTQNPFDLLRSAAISVDSDDVLYVDGTRTQIDKLLLWPVPVSNITIEHATPITVRDDGKDTPLVTTADTVGEALFAAGVTLYLGDVVTPDLNWPVSVHLVVVVDRSRPVTIIADGVSIETRTRGKTVGEALAESGVTLMGLDYAVPDENSRVIPGISIRVIRVTEEILSEQRPLPFETVYQADATIELDQRAVLQAGQEGLEESYYRVRYENGIEIQRTLESSARTREPVNRIVAYGTQIVLRVVDTPDGPREYWRKFRMIATSYHPAALGGDNVTATGRLLTKGIVGIDPDIIRYGTRLYVPGYGVGIAADTGGPRSTPYWIDLGYDDDNYVPWSKMADVYLLTPVPDTIDYLLPTP